MIVMKFIVFKPTNGEAELHMVHTKDTVQEYRKKLEEYGALDYIIEAKWNEVRDLIVKNSGITIG